jgi:D-glycero-D-manno-heptose 1,7-bisphosphate phosphatase
MNKAAFFDRDGTLIKHVSYLSRFEDVKLLPHAVRIAQYLQQHGYRLFVVTNQSGVARGFFDEQFVRQTHEYLNTLLVPHGLTIDQYYFCPHHPSEAVIEHYKVSCNCRKPLPGMLQTAALEHNLDLSRSFMFGDSPCDHEAGKAAGCLTFDMPALQDVPFVEYAKLFEYSSIRQSMRSNVSMDSTRAQET